MEKRLNKQLGVLIGRNTKFNQIMIVDLKVIIVTMSVSLASMGNLKSSNQTNCHSSQRNQPRHRLMIKQKQNRLFHNPVLNLIMI